MWKRRGMVVPPIVVEHYNHHGVEVAVQPGLRGKHREHCLCWHCARLKPGQSDNCEVAQALYVHCVKNDLVTPVYECPKFKAKG